MKERRRHTAFWRKYGFLTRSEPIHGDLPIMETTAGKPLTFPERKTAPLWVSMALAAVVLLFVSGALSMFSSAGPPRDRAPGAVAEATSHSDAPESEPEDLPLTEQVPEVAPTETVWIPGPTVTVAPSSSVRPSQSRTASPTPEPTQKPVPSPAPTVTTTWMRSQEAPPAPVPTVTVTATQTVSPTGSPAPVPTVTVTLWLPWPWNNRDR